MIQRIISDVFGRYFGVLAVPLLLATVASLPTHATAQVPAVYRETAIWSDMTLGRGVAVTLWYPGASDVPCPVVVYSHGLGGTRGDFDYLCRRWSESGFLVVSVEHPGSNDAVWRGQPFPRAALRDAYAYSASGVDRVAHIRFVLDEVGRRADQLASQTGLTVDTGRIGVAGNDLGALAAMLLGGAETVGGKTFRDERVQAILAMSPPVNGPRIEPFSSIDVPTFFITGTADNAVIGSTQAWQRRIPFDAMQLRDSYLLTLEGGDHMVYGGHIRPRRAREDVNYQAVIRDTSTVFWRAYLLNDTRALQQIRTGEGITSPVAGRMEWKEASLPKAFSTR